MEKQVSLLQVQTPYIIESRQAGSAGNVSRPKFPQSALLQLPWNCLVSQSFTQSLHSLTIRQEERFWPRFSGDPPRQNKIHSLPVR